MKNDEKLFLDNDEFDFDSKKDNLSKLFKNSFELKLDSNFSNDIINQILISENLKKSSISIELKTKALNLPLISTKVIVYSISFVFLICLYFTIFINKHENNSNLITDLKLNFKIDYSYNVFSILAIFAFSIFCLVLIDFIRFKLKNK